MWRVGRSRTLVLGAGVATLAAGGLLVKSSYSTLPPEPPAQNDEIRKRFAQQAAKAAFGAVGIAIAEEEDRVRASVESCLMQSAPLEPTDKPACMRDAVVADPSKARALLQGDGLVRVNGCLSKVSAEELRLHVNEQLSGAKGALYREPETLRFGKVRSPASRSDLKLLLQPPVRAAVEEALGSLRELCTAALGADAELYELAALVSDPGSGSQRVHPDTAMSEGPVVISGVSRSHLSWRLRSYGRAVPCLVPWACVVRAPDGSRVHPNAPDPLICVPRISE